MKERNENEKWLQDCMQGMWGHEPQYEAKNEVKRFKLPEPTEVMILGNEYYLQELTNHKN